jgi:SRSO17 transposase
MPKITTFPFFAKRFFRRARQLVGRCSFAHLWRVVIALASLQGRRSLSGLAKALGDYATRQAISYFLSQAQWDAPALLRQTAWQTVLRLGFRPGDPLYVVLDDTQKRKRGKLMQAVSKIFLHAERVYARGHTILGCVLVYRGVIIPYAVQLWASQEACQKSQQEEDPADRLTFRKLTHLAQDALLSLDLPEGVTPVVLFDSYYLCPAVAGVCSVLGWPFISVAKKSRNFAPDGRPRDKRKLGKYGRNLLARRGRRCVVAGLEHRVAERVGRLSKAGRVKLVVSQRKGDRGWVVLVTNQLSWKASKVLETYRKRWTIELLWKQSKQEMGLGDYQMLRYRGVVRYLHLVLIACLLLTHLGLNAPDVKAELKAKGELRLPSLAQLQARLRGLLWQDVFKRWSAGKRYRAAAKKLREEILV